MKSYEVPEWEVGDKLMHENELVEHTSIMWSITNIFKDKVKLRGGHFRLNRQPNTMAEKKAITNKLLTQLNKYRTISKADLLDDSWTLIDQDSLLDGSWVAIDEDSEPEPEPEPEKDPKDVEIKALKAEIAMLRATVKAQAKFIAKEC